MEDSYSHVCCTGFSSRRPQQTLKKHFQSPSPTTNNQLNNHDHNHDCQLPWRWPHSSMQDGIAVLVAVRPSSLFEYTNVSNLWFCALSAHSACYIAYSNFKCPNNFDYRFWVWNGYYPCVAARPLHLFIQPAWRACALRALGLLLADGAHTVGKGKTFWQVRRIFLRKQLY